MGQSLIGLEERGLILRRENAANRRMLLIGLAGAGKRLTRRCEAEVRTIEAAAFSGIRPEQPALMRSALHAVNTAMRSASLDGTEPCREAVILVALLLFL